jgi:hypothetical protein
MGNIKNFNFNKIDLKLSNNNYWDFYLANDEREKPNCNGLTSGDCFVVWYDFNNDNIFPNNDITSSDIYSLVYWEGSINSGYTFNSIGLTGIDNGLILFDKQSGDTSNQTLLSALTGSTLIIPSGDSRLHMSKVSGTTGLFTYGNDLTNDGDRPNIGTFANLYGGFYQGYYKIDGSTYQVLPTRVNHSWAAEFWLTREVFITPTGSTLNSVYPNNSGFFFYMGTRAENKFWNEWVGSDTGCTSGCTSDTGCTDTVSEWCTIPKENNITVIGDYGIGISLDPPRTEIDLITNEFLIYGRAYDGRPDVLTGDNGTILYFTGDNTSNITSFGCDNISETGLGTQRACSYDGEGIPITRTRQVITNNINPFLVYGRAIKPNPFSGTCCPGPQDGLGNETINSFSGFSIDETTIDYNLDIIDNALGFRIKEDGSIGYRLLTVTGSCTTGTTEQTYISGVTIKEEYSISGLVDTLNWHYIVIKFTTDYKDDCELKITKPRVGKLKFYIDGYLKHVVNDFPEFIGKRLDEYKSKQVGVPFNFSLGGGSQGLLESQTFGGLDLNDRGLPIETNFAGTFIGGISQFKFNICDLSFCNIRNSYINEAPNYGIDTRNLILLENEFLMLQEDDSGIIL